MRTLSRLGATLTSTALAIAAATVMFAAPANAAGPVRCASGGNYHFECTIMTPGTETNQVWKRNGYTVPEFNGLTYVYGNCVANAFFQIDVSFTNSSGVNMTASTTLRCLHDWL